MEIKNAPPNIPDMTVFKITLVFGLFRFKEIEKEKPNFKLKACLFRVFA